MAAAASLTSAEYSPGFWIWARQDSVDGDDKLIIPKEVRRIPAGRIFGNQLYRVEADPAAHCPSLPLVIDPLTGAINNNGSLSQHVAREDYIIPTLHLWRENIGMYYTYLQNDRRNKPREGTNLFIINEEFFSYEYAEISGNFLRLKNVRRAMLDTVPQDHPNRSHVYFLLSTDYSYVGDKMPMHPTDEPDTVWTIASPVYNGATFDEPDPYGTGITTEWKPSYNRAGSPLRPHMTTIDGLRQVTPVVLEIGEEYTISWRTRNRDTIELSYPDDPPEIGEVVDGFHQRHRVYVRDADEVEHDCGVTSEAGHANDLVITLPDMAIGHGVLYVKSEIEINGTLYVSQFQEEMPVFVTTPTMRLIENSLQWRETQTGDMRVIENG